MTKEINNIKDMLTKEIARLQEEEDTMRDMVKPLKESLPELKDLDYPELETHPATKYLFERWDAAGAAERKLREALASIESI